MKIFSKIIYSVAGAWLRLRFAIIICAQSDRDTALMAYYVVAYIEFSTLFSSNNQIKNFIYVNHYYFIYFDALNFQKKFKLKI